MRNKKNIGLIILLLTLLGSTSFAQNDYKITFYRAAPGKLLELIDLLKNKAKAYESATSHQPTVIRHSQGDQWDLMIVEYIEKRQAYYTNPNTDLVFTPNYGDSFYDIISYHESFIAQGPAIDSTEEVLSQNDYFHFEIFVALAGKQQELLKQRHMENDYLNDIGRKPNLIFTMNGTSRWDCFTLGGYRDIKHFAESADIPFEKEEAAAKKAGFKGVNDISPYLRSLIETHNDTLGGKVSVD
jgi:hypothetical protein